MSVAGFKKYVVRLSKDERSTLEDLISKGKHPAATILKARVLLKSDVSDAGEVGATAVSFKPWPRASPLSRGPANVLSKKASTRS